MSCRQGPWLSGLTWGVGTIDPSLANYSLLLCSRLFPEPPLVSEQTKVSLRSLALDAASKMTSETQERAPSNGAKM